MRRTVAGLSGLQAAASVPYSQQKIRDVGTLISGGQAGKAGALNELTGTRKPLVVRVFGEDLETLRTTAEKVRGVVAGVDGVVGPKVELALDGADDRDRDQARCRSQPRHQARRRAPRRGALLQGIQVGSIFGKQKVFDVVVQGVPSTRTNVDERSRPADRRAARLVRPARRRRHGRVRQAPAAIERDAVSRRIDVVADIRGRSESAVRKDVEARLAAMKFPLQYHAEVLKDSTSSEIGAPAMVATAIAVLIAMFLLLQAALRSWRMAALTFLTLPAALVGGMFVALVDGATLSLGALLGLLARFAIAVRGALVIVSRFQQLEDDGDSRTRPRAGPARCPRAVRRDRGRGAGDRGVPGAVRRARLAASAWRSSIRWPPSCSADSSPRRS